MEQNKENEMRVTKRNGELEDIAFDKILTRVKNVGQEADIHINYTSLAMKVIDQLYDTIKTTLIDELAAEQCASLSTNHPDYGILASRIIISNHQKNTSSSFSQVMSELYYYQNMHGKHSPILSTTFWEFVSSNSEELDQMIVNERDYLIDYFGFKTIERAYLLRIDGRIVERIQHMWLRVSCAIHLGNLTGIKETYDYMSQKYFTHATPTLFNAGMPQQQMSSCYLIAMEDDSVDGIYNTLKDCALISKYSGGIGIHIHNVRAKGSPIYGTNGKTDGIVPMLRVFNSTARYINQCGKRNGSIAVYLEPWHADIEDFLELRKNHGDEELKARDLFYALWINDLFMERIKSNGKWSLMCPNECKGLADVYGADFNELYEKYESEGKVRKTVNARDLWFQILDAQMETGTPYLLFKDACNRKSNQQNLGTIKSSNLCVAPETLILTDQGHKEIQSLAGQKVNVWNGEEFSEVTVFKTGEKQTLVEVETSDGCKLHCTPYHKFYIQNTYSKKNIEVVEAKDLNPKDKIIKCNYPVIDGKEEFKYAYTHGFFCGDGTYNKSKLTKTKCQFKALNGTSYCKRHHYYESKNEDKEEKEEEEKEEEQLLCQAISYQDKPVASLYGEKKQLLEHLEYRSVGFEDSQNRLNVSLPIDLEVKFTVPMNSSLKTKLEWFSGYCDADGCIARNGTNEQLQISSINPSFLKNVHLMLQTCGVQSKISLMKPSGERLMPDSNRELKLYHCLEIYRLMITSVELQKLVSFGFSPKRLKITQRIPNRNATQFVSIVSVKNNGREDDTYCFTEPKKHMGIFNGIITGQCSEILEYSDDKETAVCNLASVALPTFVNLETKTFDYASLHKVVKVVTRNLNNVIDINFYPTEKTRRSNMRHRPIGVGVQGLSDTFILMDIAFHSEEAKRINKDIFETMYHAALESSNEIAKNRYFKIQEEMDFYYKNFNRYPSLNDEINYLTEKKILNEWDKYTNESTTTIGSYSSFVGSPASKGILQFDLWNVEPSERYDWSELKKSIQTYGIRNSLLMAPMPTASTSQILGYNECFEPLTSNIYSRRTLAGEFVLANKYLMRDLIDLGLWNDKIKTNIIANKGSIQQLTMLPEHIRNKYKIVWEIPMKHVIDMAADRGAFICQTQSMNLWLEDPNYNTLTSMHFYSWNKGLKTGIYYLRRKGKHQAQQFTIEPEKKDVEEHDEICEMCSA